MRIARPLAFVVAVACCSLVAAQDTRPSGEGATVSDKVVAKVNRAVITQSDLDKALGAAAQRLAGKELEKALDSTRMSLVMQTVERDAVDQLGLHVPKRYVEERIEKEKEEAYKRGDSFQEVLAEKFATEEEFREDLQSQIQRQTYLAAASGSFRAQHFRPDYWPEPTIEDVRAYYRRHLADEFTLKNRARVFAIALPFSQFPAEAGRPTDERARQIAELIRDKLATGADFATLARQYSRSQEFKPEQGGDLGWIEEEKSAYNPLIVNFASKASVKELSSPIPYPRADNPRSLLLLWVDERVDRRVVTFAEAQSAIRDGLRAERLRNAKGRIQAKLLEDAYIWPPALKQQLLSLTR